MSADENIKTHREAQMVWASMGGLGPIPSDATNWGLLVRGEAGALEECRRAVALQHHEIHTSLVVAALTGQAPAVHLANVPSGAAAALSEAARLLASATLADMVDRAKESAKAQVLPCP